MDYKALYEEEVEKRKDAEKRAHEEAEMRKEANEKRDEAEKRAHEEAEKHMEAEKRAKKVESEFDAYRYAKFMRERDLLRKCTMRCRYTEYNFIPRPC
jgi:hypothetical protein